jgi:CheY-like chemotaxis protein
MRKRPDETMESWAARVEMFEKGRALQRIAKGDDPDIVMEDMSRRVMDKLLYPILNAIRNSVPDDYDVEKGRREYDEIMKYVEKAADHVDADT